MKQLFFLLIAFLFLTGCKSSPSVEDQMYDCIQSEFKKKGVDLESLLDRIEQRMIKDKLLSGKGGDAFIEYYKNIVATGQVKGFYDKGITEELSKVDITVIFNSSCRQRIKEQDSALFARSKFNLVSERIQMHVANQGQISPVTVAKAILKELSAEDFEHPYYRTFALLSLAFTMDQDTAYIKNIPKRIERSGNISLPEKGIKIWLFNSDSVTIENTRIHIDQLPNQFESIKSSRNPKEPVYIILRPETKFEVFMKVQGVIEEYTNKMRNKEARKRFQKPYDDLNASQKQQVDKAYPMTVIEKMND